MSMLGSNTPQKPCPKRSGSHQTATIKHGLKASYVQLVANHCHGQRMNLLGRCHLDEGKPPKVVPNTSWPCFMSRGGSLGKKLQACCLFSCSTRHLVNWCSTCVLHQVPKQHRLRKPFTQEAWWSPTNRPPGASTCLFQTEGDSPSQTCSSISRMADI